MQSDRDVVLPLGLGETGDMVDVGVREPDLSERGVEGECGAGERLRGGSGVDQYGVGTGDDEVLVHGKGADGSSEDPVGAVVERPEGCLGHALLSRRGEGLPSMPPSGGSVDRAVVRRLDVGDGGGIALEALTNPRDGPLVVLLRGLRVTERVVGLLTGVGGGSGRGPELLLDVSLEPVKEGAHPSHGRVESVHGCHVLTKRIPERRYPIRREVLVDREVRVQRSDEPAGSVHRANLLVDC